ncbi:MAG: ATP-dependent metallopeptidase FtsH/Yme1/Tma family protein [Clostridium sp.]|nr:ATP-dependent metallopeptidase FtsH/Yme1/Tma family protein [Clostridium sp.]MBQ8999691.1 ATP-dependent metallopeptidase FtsH/Yme1/Tma family protein [Clostridium sp.]
MQKNNKKENKKNKKNKKNKLFNAKTVIIGGSAILLTSRILTSDTFKAKEISYNEFVSKVEKKDVTEIKFNVDNSTLIIIDKDKNVYKTINPNYENFRKEHLEKGIKFSESKNLDVKSLLSLSISATLLYAILSNNPLSGNKNANLLEGDDIPKVKFKDVLGLEEVKNDLKLTVEFLKEPEKFAKFGAEMSTGIVFYGPPGTGKTMLAKSVAGEAGVPFYNISGSAFVELYAGMGARKVRKLFEEARKNSPCIIFIDEIDAVGKKRSASAQSNDERDQTLNELLTQLDGFEKNEGVFVIAATNRLETLDEALLRPGRFGKHIRIPLPKDKDERLAILKVNASNKKVDDSILEHMAKISTSFSGADLKNFLNECALIQILEEKEAIDLDIVDKALFKIATKGSKIPTKDRMNEENKIVAWHEAGHVLTSKLYGQEFVQATIVGSSSGVGGFSLSHNNDKKLLKVSDLKKEVKVLYGGRIAESFILDEDITFGASNDIEKASGIIRDMVSSYGMNSNKLMLDFDTIENKKYLIDEATNLSKELYEEALKDLYENKGALEDIANALLEKETIYDSDVEEILKKHKDANVIEIA